jgi:AcrR family transcriptional regulator
MVQSETMIQGNSAPNAAEAVEKRSTLSADDWEREALVLIAAKGVQGLAVEPLARRMGITKGSFYWHFSTRDALLLQTLIRWEAHDTRNIQTALGAIDKPRDRLRDFFRRVGKENLTHEVYREMCAAASHPIVAPVLERVTKRRMAYLSAAFRELGLEAEAAENQARLAYSAYLGFLQLQRQHQAPDVESDTFENYMEHVIQQLID